MRKKSNSVASSDIRNHLKTVKYVKPDGGYGYVILTVGLLISFILDGGMYSFGIILNDIKNYYGVTQDIANLVPSFNVGFVYLVGPFSSALSKHFGSRIVIMISAVAFSAAYVASAFLPSIYYMVAIFGVFGGISFGCCYLSFFIILVQYFDKKLGLANGLTMAGSGGLTLQCCVLGALLRPVTLKRIYEPISQFELSLINEKNADKEVHEEVNFGSQSNEEIESYENKKVNNDEIISISNHLHEEKPLKKESFIKILLFALKESINFSLLFQNIPFLLFAISNFLIFFVYQIPFIFIPIRAKSLGITNYAWILSFIGITNIPARIILGIICDRKLVKPILMYAICSLLGGLSSVLYFFLPNFYWQLLFSFTFGISAAGLNSLPTPNLIDIVGEEKYSNAYGIMNFFIGFGFITGPFTAGFIYERTNIMFIFLYSAVFYLVVFVMSIISYIYLKRKTKKQIN